VHYGNCERITVRDEQRERERERERDRQTDHATVASVAIAGLADA